MLFDALTTNAKNKGRKLFIDDLDHAKCLSDHIWEVKTKIILKHSKYKKTCQYLKKAVRKMKQFERLDQIVNFYRSEPERCQKAKSFFLKARKTDT